MKSSGKQSELGMIAPSGEFADVRMVSFDVFDTLLFRVSGGPDDFFRHLAKEATSRGLWPQDELKAFTELRIRAESKARDDKYQTVGHREVTLRDIYQAWPQLDTDKMCALEAEIELADWCINSVLVSWIRELIAAGTRVALLSDMYLESETILAFLSQYLPEEGIELVLVSGECGCSKHDGGLYQQLIQQSKLETWQILHVGDNSITDGQMAQANGLKSFTQDFDYIHQITRYERRLTTSIPRAVDALRKRWTWSEQRPSTVKRTGALIYGPFLWGFCRWLLERCKALGIKQIFCLLREGDLLADVLKIIADGSIKVSTLSISRRASWLPSLENIDENVLYQLCQRRAYTLSECLEDLNLNAPGHWQTYLSRELNSLVSTPLWLELQTLFINHVDDIKQYLIQQRELFAIYLSQQGVTNSPEIALLDWGCGGSLFANICRVVDLPNVHFFMAYASPKSLSFALEYALESFIPAGDERAQVIAASPELSEILLNGELLSTKAYMMQSSEVIPVPVAKEKVSDGHLQHLRDFRDAVLQFCKLAKCIPVARYSPMSAHQRTAFGAILYRFIQYPLNEEAQTFAELPLPLTATTHCPLISPKAIEEMRANFAVVSSAFEGITLGKYQTNASNAWLPGTLALAFPSSMGLFGELAFVGGNEVVAPMLLQQLKQRGIKRTVIYGAGELGIQVKRLLTENNIEVSYFVDRRASTSAFCVDDVTVITFAEAIAKGERVFAVASRAFAVEINNHIASSLTNNIGQITVCLLSGTHVYDS